MHTLLMDCLGTCSRGLTSKTTDQKSRSASLTSRRRFREAKICISSWYSSLQRPERYTPWPVVERPRKTLRAGCPLLYQSGGGDPCRPVCEESFSTPFFLLFPLHGSYKCTTTCEHNSLPQQHSNSHHLLCSLFPCTLPQSLDCPHPHCTSHTAAISSQILCRQSRHCAIHRRSLHLKPRSG